MRYTFFVLSLLVFSSLTSAQDIRISGRSFYKDAKIWLPKGIEVEGFNRPISSKLPDWANTSAKQARAWWGDKELSVIKDTFGSDVIRFAVSQPGLDPQSPIYSPDYLAELKNVVTLARSKGLVVILSMDNQAENYPGASNLACMPDESTARAWQTLAPTYVDNKAILFEIFNEPCRSNWADSRKEWAQKMQTLVTALRSSGAQNILLLDGLEFAQSVNDLFSLVHDTLPNRLAMAVHPYVNSLKGVDLNNLDGYFYGRFGKTADKDPIIATEWNATPTNGCIGDSTPKVALALVKYLQTRHIGLIGWAIDSNSGKMVKDHTKFQPTDYQSFTGCSKTPAESGGGFLIAKFPNN